jgi:PAS domain S-box-containing protein
MRRKSGNDVSLSGGAQNRLRDRSRPESPRGHPEYDTAAFLAAIVESSSDAIISKDLNGIITSWNQGAEHIFQYKPSEVIGRPITILIPPKHIQEETFILDRIRHGERVEHFETVRRRKDGSRVDISLTVSPIRDNSGKIIGASKIAKDISEERRARERLRQSEERFRVTLSSIGDAVIATDCEGRVTFMNPVAETLTGWTGEDASGNSLDEVFRIINELTRQPVKNPVTLVLEKGVVVGLGNHTILISKDGGERPIDDSAAPIRNPEGAVAGVVLVFRDATQQRSAEATARKLVALIEDSDDAIYGADLDGTITSWNPAAERIFGYSSAEIVGRSIFAMLPRQRRDEESQILARIGRGERIEHYETVRHRKDGSEVDISLTVSPVKDLPSGRIIGISKIARDITAHKRAEAAALEAGERYRSLFNSMDEGFSVIQMIFDGSNQPQDYRFLEVNTAFEKQTGIQNAPGRRMREIAPHHEKHWFEIYGKVALTGEPIRFENRAEALNRWFDVYAYRVGQPEEGKVAILFNDITKRKEAEQALARANRELEAYAQNLQTLVDERTIELRQSVADLEAFSFTISHDLRSPLRSMQGFAHAVLSEYADKLDAQGRDYLQRISNSAARLDKLILEVLTYSRAARLELALTPIDLDRLMEEVLQTYPEIRTANAEVTVEHPLRPVLASHASLVQCVSNLLTNAVKFVRPGEKAKVRVWTETADSKVRLLVRDGGIGIPESLQSKIFEPFQRGHPHAGYEGTGMGLAIVRKAMLRMNGNVGVESGDGEGSTFWLELPCAP